MGATAKYEINQDYICFRPVGQVSLAEFTPLITEAIVHTRERGISKLLINTTALTGFASPNPADRFFMVREWAAASKGVVQVAFVARPEMIDPQRFGVTVARNLGFNANAFTAESAALGWLTRLPVIPAPEIPPRRESRA